MPEVQRVFSHGGRFIAFWATGRAGNAKGRKIALPALPYSRPATLRSLLSVALSSARQFDSSALVFLYRKWSRFQIQNGSVFDVNFNLHNLPTGLVFNVKVVSFSLAKNSCSIGQVVLVWLTYILTEGDHRLSYPQEWVRGREKIPERLPENQHPGRRFQRRSAGNRLGHVL